MQCYIWFALSLIEFLCIVAVSGVCVCVRVCVECLQMTFRPFIKSTQNTDIAYSWAHTVTQTYRTHIVWCVIFNGNISSSPMWRCVRPKMSIVIQSACNKSTDEINYNGGPVQHNPDTHPLGRMKAFDCRFIFYAFAEHFYMCICIGSICNWIERMSVAGAVWTCVPVHAAQICWPNSQIRSCNTLNSAVHTKYWLQQHTMRFHSKNKIHWTKMCVNWNVLL